MKKILLAVIILLMVSGGWIFLKNKKESIVENNSTSNNTVVYSDTGYVPNTLTIKQGETVTWENKSKYSMWTASAMHPSHRAYPGTDITACGTQTLLPMFDACQKIEPGQSWSFKFDNIGNWKYHNHSNSSHFGTIVVE